MRIRWKLLLLFLMISLLPALVIGLWGLSTMRQMGQTVGQLTREALIAQVTISMRRLVEDHALVLRSQFDLQEAVLDSQARKIEYLLEHPPSSAQNFTTPITSELEVMRKDNSTQPATMLHANSEVVSGPGNMFIYMPPGMTIDSQRAKAIRALSHMALTHEANRKLLGRLALRQFTALDDGIVAFYPALPGISEGSLASMYDPRQMSMDFKSLDHGGARWSQPYIDPFTGDPVIMVSTPIRLKGRNVGVSGICVSLSLLLHQNPQHLLYSKLHTWILRPSHTPNNSIGLKLVVADSPVGGIDEHAVSVSSGSMHRMHHLLRLPNNNELFQLGDPVTLTSMVKDIRAGRTGDKIVRFDDHSENWLLTYAPIYSGGNTLVIAVPEVEAVSRAMSASEYIADKTAVLERSVGLWLVTVLVVCIIVAFYLSNRITCIITALSETVARVAGGDFSARTQIISQDELGELALTFNSLVPALEDQVRMKETLGLAQEIHERLQPRMSPLLAGFEMAGCSQACDETGGDYYDFIKLDDGRYVVAIGDVSGHGLPAALLMASIRGFLRGRMMGRTELSSVGRDVNQLVLADAQGSGHFMSLLLLALDPEIRRVTWLRAGHPPPLLYEPPQPGNISGSVRELKDQGGITLGVVSDAVYQECEGLTLTSGQVLLLVTDGICEAIDRNGRQYGNARLQALLAESAHRSADEIVRIVFEDVGSFSGFEKPEDDMTVVVVKALSAPATKDEADDKSAIEARTLRQ